MTDNESAARAALADLHDAGEIGPWELISRGAFGLQTWGRSIDHPEMGELVVVVARGIPPHVHYRLSDPRYDNDEHPEAAPDLERGEAETFEAAMAAVDEALARVRPAEAGEETT